MTSIDNTGSMPKINDIPLPFGKTKAEDSAQKAATERKPPKGKYVTSAVLYMQTNTDGANSFDDKVITDAQGGDFGLKVDLIAKDTYTGENILLTGVRVKTLNASMTTGYAKGQSFELTAPSYEAFALGKIEQMVAIKSSEKPMIQNESIPVPAIIRNDVSSLADSTTAECQKFNQRYNMMKRQMGLIHDRNDLTVLSSGKNGRAPGMVISDDAGTLHAFDATGKQYLAMSGNSGIEVAATQFDTGHAEKTTTDDQGRYMKYNTVNETISQGTIVIPSPASVPNVTKYLTLIQSVVDIVDLSVVMGKAIYLFATNDIDGLEELGDTQQNSDIIKEEKK